MKIHTTNYSDTLIEISGTLYTVGQMIVFDDGTAPIVLAREATTLVMMGGEPLGERFIWWNFVSSRKERIEQAKADWRAGRIDLPPVDNHEFVPLPEYKLRSSVNPAPQALS